MIHSKNVFGYYGRNSTASEAFRPVFKSLFGAGEVDFVNDIKRVSRTDHVILGGGALLNQHFLGQLKFIDAIHPVGVSLPNGSANLEALEPLRNQLRRLYVTSTADVALLQEHGYDAVYTPDLLFSLTPAKISFTAKDFERSTNLPPLIRAYKKHTVLVFVSHDDMIPYSADAGPKFLQAERLKGELAASLDALAGRCNIVFVPLTVWYGTCDFTFAIEIVRRMKNRQKVCIVDRYVDPMDLLAAMAAIDATVISTQFYGLVFGLITGNLVVNIGGAKRNQALMREADLRGFSLTGERVTAQRIETLASKHNDASARARIAAARQAWGDAARGTLAAFRATLS
jgi:polysaccharide pyruvyl transferase WcaK-like protein